MRLRMMVFFLIECCTLLFHLWYTTAWVFGKSRLCSSNPGQANVACFIESKVLNMSPHSACHHTHAGQCEHSYINSWRNSSKSGQSPGSFVPGPTGWPTSASLSTQCHSGPSRPPTRNAHQGLVWVSWRGLLQLGWVIPEGCRMLCPWPKCRVNLLVQKCLERASTASG